jgi:hypothetical protein
VVVVALADDRATDVDRPASVAALVARAAVDDHAATVAGAIAVVVAGAVVAAAEVAVVAHGDRAVAADIAADDDVLGSCAMLDRHAAVVTCAAVVCERDATGEPESESRDRK